MSEQLEHPPREMTARELTVQLGEQMSQLLRQELALAKAEMFTRARQMVLGGGMLAVAALLGLTGYLALIAAIIAGVAVALPPWAATAIVGGGLVVIAGGLAALAARRLSGGLPPLHLTIESIRRDVGGVRARARR